MISAKDVVTTLTAEDEAAIKVWEAKIDAALRQYEGRPILVDIGPSTRRKVLERLCAMYRMHGWTAAIETGDQRDPGPWIRFDVAPPEDMRR